MNRRNFLQALGGATLITAVPVLASTPANLTQWFEQNFECWMGQPSPYHKDPDGAQHKYQTFAAGVLGDDAEKAKLQLTQYFVNMFTPFANPKQRAVWRATPEFASGELVTYGKSWMTAEQIEDTPRGETVAVPAGVEFDLYTGAYRYVDRKETIHRMRFRVAIIGKYRELEALAKPEGNPVKVV
jgi:hypothetical protein